MPQYYSNLFVSISVTDQFLLLSAEDHIFILYTEYTLELNLIFI